MSRFSSYSRLSFTNSNQSNHLLKNLELAMSNRRAAVQSWRDAGSHEDQWEAFTSAADVLVDIAEKNLINH